MLAFADPFDLPFEPDAAGLENAAPHFLAQGLDIGGAGRAPIDQKIAMQLRHLCIADHKAATARGIDQLPGFMAGWILERRTAGTRGDRLALLPRLG